MQTQDKKPAETVDDESTVEKKDESLITLSPSNAVILVLAVIIIAMSGYVFRGESDGESAPVVSAVSSASASMPEQAPAVAAVETGTETGAAATPAPAPSVSTMSMPSMPVSTAHGAGMEAIERKGEGRLFYSTIKIPAGAETLYLSGTGASQKSDGTWGNMEEQAIDTFNKFKATLEGEGWSMSDIVQVRAFAVAGDYGLLDFDGFNRGYSRFFGTTENPNKPVRSFVQVADLVVDGWLVEVEIRAARVP